MEAKRNGRRLGHFYVCFFFSEVEFRRKVFPGTRKGSLISGKTRLTEATPPSSLVSGEEEPGAVTVVITNAVSSANWRSSISRGKCWLKRVYQLCRMWTRSSKRITSYIGPNGRRPYQALPLMEWSTVWLFYKNDKYHAIQKKWL